MTRAEILQLSGQKLDVAVALTQGWQWLRQWNGLTLLLPPGYILRYDGYELSSADAERRSDWASLIPDYHASLESAWQLDGKDWNWHIRDHYVCGDRQLTFLIVQRYTWQRLAIVVMPWVEHGFATGRCRAYLLAKLAEEEEGQ